MDYRRYLTLMERYKELGTLSIDKQDTRESLIEKLVDVSREKKQILVETNAIIKECITKYEKEPGLLDKEAIAMLDDFLLLLRSPKGGEGGMDPVDPSVSLRIARLLLPHYQSTGDPEQIIQILRQCAIYDLILKEHQYDYESTQYAGMADRYLADYETISDEAIRTLMHCMTIGGYNKKDLTFGLRMYGMFEDTLLSIRRKVGMDDFTLRYYHTLLKMNALGYALSACFKTEEYKRRGITLSEPLIDLEKYAPLMDKFRQELEEILLSEQVQSLIYDRVSVKLYLAQTDFHLGKITLDELFEKIKEYSVPLEEYSAYEQSSALLTCSLYYLDYLCVFSDYDSRYVQNESIKIIKHVMESTEEAVKELSEESQFSVTSMTNRTVLDMLSTASGFLDFDFFKRTVLYVTVYTNKELYVHTMMVREITLAILEYILEHDPQYLDGVAGYDWEYCRDHKQELTELMENCALLHDIGKYFCLDIVNNSSRSLTDDEFEIIKEHPTNFSKIYKGGMSPHMQCIRDCAELHHLWYDETGGYPRKTHTVNKPFVNILTIADCIDAATDNIGRPYGFGKTLEQVMEEFDSAKDTRYSGYITELLHVEEIQQKIRRAINDRRKDIYCDIYLKK
ncbi:MAG: hypothetical protein J1E39_05555 [Eubacterium sp.]|nr:hypothetical protein [Eubacterium sp.]